MTKIGDADDRAHADRRTRASRPNDASLIARKPQVGASSHEIGPTQAGSSESGTSSPVTIQTGYCIAIPSANADR